MNSKLKLLVNNPEIWVALKEEVEARILFLHKQLEQREEPTTIFRLQGEVQALRKILRLRDDVNGNEPTA